MKSIICISTLVLVIGLTGSCKKENGKVEEKISDIDGNVYTAVVIGTQSWMAENLKTTKYNDGTVIPNITDNLAWTVQKTAAYCWFNNDEANKAAYGAIYNWFAVDSKRLCPTGWHVPTDTEFNALEMYLGIPQTDVNTWGWRGTDQGSQLKNTTGWLDGQDGSNTSGFSALPGGYRYAVTGNFNDLMALSYWWTASKDDTTRAWYRRLDGTNNGIYKASTEIAAGKYVRCIKD